MSDTSGLKIRKIAKVPGIRIELHPEHFGEDIVPVDDNGNAWMAIRADYGASIFVECQPRDGYLLILAPHTVRALEVICAATRKIELFWVQGPAPRINAVKAIPKQLKKEYRSNVRPYSSSSKDTSRQENNKERAQRVPSVHGDGEGESIDSDIPTPTE